MVIIGYFGGLDPAACLLRDGVVESYVEEERLLRYKHAPNIFPIRSIACCLRQAGLELDDVDYLAYGWDIPSYTNGDMSAFYQRVNARHPPDRATLSWQNGLLNQFHDGNFRERLRQEIVPFFGTNEVPPLRFFPHHASHAATAYYMSPYREALIVTIDGSGDSQCATVWLGIGDRMELIHEIEIPDSLGWFYAAITEFLGFQAYDGEHKVMGLAAYGRPNRHFREALERVVPVAADGWNYHVRPEFIHHGPHTYSDRFTDHLVTLLGLPPRQGPAALGTIHEELAFEAQRVLEDRVLRLVRHFRIATGRKYLCLAGGVALNVKMNSRVRQSGLFDDVFVFPIPSDSGTAIGAALGIYHELTGKRPQPLEHVYLGPAFTDEDIELQLESCGLVYRVCDDIAEATADLLTQGKVVGWFQGRIEAGPRALGARSILADPRSVESRDRVNAAIKFREYWRPFCPSVLEEAAPLFMRDATPAPFMITAFEATEHAAKVCPAIVHADGTMRVQTVNGHAHPRFYELLKAFERRTGVPVLLNTSFNIKGEAMVCSPRDALRTFWSTGLDALAIGRCLIEKPQAPLFLEPEEVLR
jgi:carbamoyltransferase